MAQNSELKPLNWQFEFNKDSNELKIEAELPKGISAYATYQSCTTGPEALNIKLLDSNQNEIILDTIISRHTYQEFDDIFECHIIKFKDKATILIPLQSIKEGYMIKMRYQVCNDAICMMYFENYIFTNKIWQLKK